MSIVCDRWPLGALSMARAAILFAAWLFAGLARADVVVLANQTDAEVGFVIASSSDEGQEYRISAGDVLPVPVPGETALHFHDGDEPRQYVLEPGEVYYFAREDGRLDVHQVVFPTSQEKESPDAASMPGDAGSPAPVPLGGVESFFRIGVVPVLALVDDEEAAAREVWEKRLRDRLERASDIVERYSRIRFRVVAVGTWESDDAIRDFSQSLREFEVEVIPAPAALAIGFTSQYELPRNGRTHLGGIRGPLRPHLLIQEGPPKVSQAERLEVLVHELGHYLGAVHCPAPDSVMRPILGDGRARARDFPIRFDAVNTLVMYLVGSEIRSRAIRTLSQLSPPSKERLRTVFSAAEAAFPADPVPAHHLRMLEGTPLIVPQLRPDPGTLVGATSTVVEAIVEAAEANCQDRGDSAGSPGASGQLSGDELAELYFRRAAAAAASLSPELAEKAYLLGLTIAIDDSTLLRNNLLVGKFCRQVESDSQRQRRLKALRSPTMRNRRDLAQHFVVSCGLAVWFGGGAAEAIGISKELADSQTGSGFSFADLSADLAGVTFAEHVADGNVTLASLAESFTVDSFLPDHAGLPENISWSEFARTYGTSQDDRFLREKATIRDRIEALSGYSQAQK